MAYVKNSPLERKTPLLQEAGYASIPFPSNLATLLHTSIEQYIAKATGSSAPSLTERLFALSDRDFIAKFSKPFRIFPDPIGYALADWVSGLTSYLGGNRSGINYICPSEMEANPQLQAKSYDTFWRCVRPGKPDVGKPPQPQKIAYNRYIGFTARR